MISLSSVVWPQVVHVPQSDFPTQARTINLIKLNLSGLQGEKKKVGWELIKEKGTSGSQRNGGGEARGENGKNPFYTSVRLSNYYKLE